MFGKGDDQNGSGEGPADGGSDEESPESSKDEEKPNVKASVAGVVEALTELVSVQTPASVWLPNKRLTMQSSGKVLSHPFNATCPFKKQKSDLW